MKKRKLFNLLSIITMAAAGAFAIGAGMTHKKAESAEAAGTIGSTITVYFNCSGDLSWWVNDNAETHVHYYGGTSSSTWPGATMSLVSGETYLFSCDIPSDTTKVNFTRVQPNTSNVWNRIANSTDIDVPVWTSNNTFHAYHDNYGDGNYAGSWELTSYTVSQYRVLDGVKEASAFKTDTVGGGLTYATPSSPSLSDYTFTGWYTNEACTISYTGQRILEDLTLYAKFSTVSYTVTKYKVLDGAGPVEIESESVGSGTIYEVPDKRYEAGYSFGGWYTNPACTTPYTAQEISSDISIYAKYVSASFSGSIHIDLKDSGWAEAGASYAVLFMDKTTYSEEVNGWSSYVTGTSAGEHLVTVPYSLGFEPLQMTVVRYNPEKTDWATEKWTDTWGQTPDLTFGEMVRIGNTYDLEDKNISYVGYPKVTTWSPSSADIFLNSVKLNGLNNTEYYSPSVTLAENQEFKVQAAPYADGDYHGSYSTHASIESNFKTGESGNIVCVVPGTYAFYFDGLADSIYITKVEIAEADEWAQAFLGADCAATKSSWSASESSYESLSADAKAILSGAEHVAHNVDVSGFVERAVQRYDYLIERYGKETYNDFMGRDGVKITSGSLASVDVGFINSSDSTNLIIIVSVVSLVSASTLIGLIVIKKRKGIAK